MDYKRYGGNNDLYWVNATDNDPKLKVIMEGDYRGRHFVIGAHCLGHPNAYLEVKKEDAMMQEAKDHEYYDGGLCRVNGGSTYFGKAYWDDSDERTYVGWDYAHYGDYSARWPGNGGQVWSIIDILMEISCAENEIMTANDNDPEYYNRLRNK